MTGSCDEVLCGGLVTKPQNRVISCKPKKSCDCKVLVKSYARSYAVLCGVRITLLHFGECFGSPEIFTTKTGLVYVVMRSLMTTKAS